MLYFTKDELKDILKCVNEYSGMIASRSAIVNKINAEFKTRRYSEQALSDNHIEDVVEEKSEEIKIPMKTDSDQVYTLSEFSSKMSTILTTFIQSNIGKNSQIIMSEYVMRLNKLVNHWLFDCGKSTTLKVHVVLRQGPPYNLYLEMQWADPVSGIPLDLEHTFVGKKTYCKLSSFADYLENNF